MIARLLMAHPGREPQTPVAELLRTLEPSLDCTCLALDPRRAVEALQLDLVDAAARVPCDGTPLIVGGFSLGARLAALASSQTAAHGFVGLSFPFHKHGNPQERHGLAALTAVAVPMLVIQGTRDSHGSQAAVRNMSLPVGLRIAWLADGNHAWRPRSASGHSLTTHVQSAAQHILAFCAGLVRSAHD